MTTVPTQPPLPSELEIKKRMKQERRVYDRYSKMERGTEEDIEQMRASADSLKDLRKQLQHRRHGDAIKAAPVSRGFEEAAKARELRKAALRPAVRALSRIHLPPGVTNLDPSKLTPEQGQELFEIVFSEEPRSPAQQARWEELIEIAAGEPGLYEQRRQVAAIAAKESELREQERIASLPQRPPPPPGGIALPAELARELVEGRDDGLTPLRLGVLAGVLLGLESRVATMVGSRVEDETLVVTSSPPRFDPQDGSSDVKDALTYLRIAGWLEVGRGPEGLRIRRGERALALLEGGDSGP